PGSHLVREHHDIPGGRRGAGRPRRKIDRVPTRNPRTHRSNNLLHSARTDRSDAAPAPAWPTTLLRDGLAGNRHRRPTPAIRPANAALAIIPLPSDARATRRLLTSRGCVADRRRCRAPMLYGTRAIAAAPSSARASASGWSPAPR